MSEKKTIRRSGPYYLWTAEGEPTLLPECIDVHAAREVAAEKARKAGVRVLVLEDRGEFVGERVDEVRVRRVR